MSYKVIRVAGNVVAFGPNDENYSPVIPLGGAVSVENVMPFPSPSERAAAKRAELVAACEGDISTIRAGYSESEVLSWPKQEAEARALVVDVNAATPLLDALAEARGIDKSELAARVIAKADAFAAISGALIGKRQRLEDQLDALPADATPEQVAAIVW